MKKFKTKNAKKIAEEIAHVYKEKKESGEEHPIDDTVEEIMQIFKDNPNPEKVREILKSILEKKDIPNRIFEKAATKISNEEEIPDSVITDVVKNSETNISDESINRIIEEGNIDVKERINLMHNVENKDIIEERVENELKILYRVCKDKRDDEVLERINELREILQNNKMNPEIENLIKQVVAKKMAENYYSDISKGTNVYTLSKIIPVEDMLENDLPSTVENEYQKIEENRQKKKVDLTKRD